MTLIWELANPQLRNFTVYEPGKPIEETARELGVEPDAIVKLASNENPIGPSPKAIHAMRVAAGDTHLYPDGGGFYLCKAIAARLRLEPGNIILGNGSNEVIEFLGHAFLNLDDHVITSEYAFIVYKLITTSFGAQLIETPTPNFQQNVDAMLDAVTPKTRFIFIPNPKNPPATLFRNRTLIISCRAYRKILLSFSTKLILSSSMIRPTCSNMFAKAETLLSCARSRKFTDSPVCALATGWGGPTCSGR